MIHHFYDFKLLTFIHWDNWDLTWTYSFLINKSFHQESAKESFKDIDFHQCVFVMRLLESVMYKFNIALQLFREQSRIYTSLIRIDVASFLIKKSYEIR